MSKKTHVDVKYKPAKELKLKVPKGPYRIVLTFPSGETLDLFVAEDNTDKSHKGRIVIDLPRSVEVVSWIAPCGKAAPAMYRGKARANHRLTGRLVILDTP